MVHILVSRQGLGFRCETRGDGEPPFGSRTKCRTAPTLGNRLLTSGRGAV